jgi:hypothetical protein
MLKVVQAILVLLIQQVAVTVLTVTADQAAAATQEHTVVVAQLEARDTLEVVGTLDMLVVAEVAPAVEDKITLAVIPAAVAELG